MTTAAPSVSCTISEVHFTTLRDHVVAHHEHRTHGQDLIGCVVATWTKRRTTTEISNSGSRRSFTAFCSWSGMFYEASWAKFVYAEASWRRVIVYYVTWLLYFVVLFPKLFGLEERILHDLANRSIHGSVAASSGKLTSEEGRSTLDW